MSRIVREIPLTKNDTSESSKGQYQQEIRETVSHDVNALNLTTSDTIIKVTDKKHFLAPQSFEIGGFTATNSRLDSAGGAKVTIKTIFSGGTHIIDNIDFVLGCSLVASAVVRFQGCRFFEVITMAAGSKAAFVGCTFEGTAYVNNAGLAADAGVIGCVKTSTTAHVNVTDIFSI